MKTNITIQEKTIVQCNITIPKGEGKTITINPFDVRKVFEWNGKTYLQTNEQTDYEIQPGIIDTDYLAIEVEGSAAFINKIIEQTRSDTQKLKELLNKERTIVNYSVEE